MYALLRASVAVLDVSAPAEPRVLATIAVAATDLALVGDRLYLAGPALSVFDVSSPAQPRLVAQSPALSGRRLAAVGTTVYLHERITVRVGDAVRRPAVLRVGDVSDPAAPRLVAELTVDDFDPRDSIGVAVAAGRAYLLDEGSTMSVVDVADPARPVLLGQRGLRGGFLGAELEVVGGYAYVANRVEGVSIYDLADPAQPVAVAVYDSPGSALDVHVVGGHAYVADYTSGLRVLAVDAPAAPREVGPVATESVDYIRDDGSPYLVPRGGGLRIYDVADPAAPRELAFLELTRERSAYGIALLDPRTVLVGDESLAVVDVSDPTQPRRVGTYAGRFFTVAVEPPFALVARSYGDVELLGRGRGLVADRDAAGAGVAAAQEHVALARD